MALVQLEDDERKAKKNERKMKNVYSGALIVLSIFFAVSLSAFIALVVYARNSPDTIKGCLYVVISLPFVLFFGLMFGTHVYLYCEYQDRIHNIYIISHLLDKIDKDYIKHFNGEVGEFEEDGKEDRSGRF